MSRNERIPPVDFPREERHPFVLCGVPAERVDAEADEIGCLKKQRHNDLAVVRRVCGVIGYSAVIVSEPHESRIFYAVGFKRRNGENGPLRKRHLLGEIYFIVELEQRFEGVDSPSLSDGEFRTALLQSCRLCSQLRSSEFCRQRFDDFFHRRAPALSILELAEKIGCRK